MTEPQDNVTSLARAPLSYVALTLALPLATGCVSEPRAGAPAALVSAQRVLAKDFGERAASKRTGRLSALPRSFTAELERPSRWLRAATGIDQEARRASRAAASIRAGVASAATRHPTELGRWLLDVREFERDAAEDIQLSTRLLGTSLHPLGEISDREHRTDPTDDRPELTFWQRLKRRLRL